MLINCFTKDFGEFRIIEHIVYQNDNVKISNTKKYPFRVVPELKNDSVVEDGVLKALLPRLSWNIIRISIGK